MSVSSSSVGVGKGRAFPRSVGPRPTREEEADLGKRFRAGDAAAGHRLVEANLTLVVALAARRAKGLRAHDETSVCFEDLVSAGYVGLCKAANAWDPERKGRDGKPARFGALAAIVVLHEINVAQIGGFSCTAGRQNHVNMLGEFGRATATLRRDGNEPSREELAALLDWSLETLEAFLRLLGGESRLDEPLAGSDRHPSDLRTLQSVHADPEAASQEELLADLEERARFREAVREVLLELHPRERAVLERRYLAPERDGEDDVRTLADVGRELDYTRERVRQIETEALRKVRKRMLAGQH